MIQPVRTIQPVGTIAQAGIKHDQPPQRPERGLRAPVPFGFEPFEAEFAGPHRRGQHRLGFGDDRAGRAAERDRPLGSPGLGGGQQSEADRPLGPHQGAPEQGYHLGQGQ